MDYNHISPTNVYPAFVFERPVNGYADVAFSCESQRTLGVCPKTGGDESLHWLHELVILYRHSRGIRFRSLENMRQFLLSSRYLHPEETRSLVHEVRCCWHTEGIPVRRKMMHALRQWETDCLCHHNLHGNNDLQQILSLAQRNFTMVAGALTSQDNPRDTLQQVLNGLEMEEVAIFRVARLLTEVDKTSGAML